jgi:anion-transporting  ArsA/GET3 family ATPase
VDRFFDEIVGLDLLRDMAEFFQAFGPLFSGFKERAIEVERLLRSPETVFILVSGPGEEKIPDTLFFARRLGEAGLRLGPVVVNRIHPVGEPGVEARLRGEEEGRRLLERLAAADRRGVEMLSELLDNQHELAALPLLEDAPSDLSSLGVVASLLDDRLGAGEAADVVCRSAEIA